MIPKETPIGSRVRVYIVQGDESTAWTGKTTSPVSDDRVTVRLDGGGRSGSESVDVMVSHIEPIGARPFISHKFTCPNCKHEFTR